MSNTSEIVVTANGGSGSVTTALSPDPNLVLGARCLWCDRTFTPRVTGGSTQRFCCIVFVMTKVFHRSTEDALALTLAVHTQGKGIAGTYTFEVAEQKQCEVLLMAKIEEHPLRVEVEQV